MNMKILLAAVFVLFSCTSAPVPVHHRTNDAAVSAPPSRDEPVTGTLSQEPVPAPSVKQKKPPGLQDSEIEKQIRNTIPASFAPVTEGGGRIKIIYHDLDSNGYKDAFFLVIKKQKGISADIDSLSDVSGLADSEHQPIDYFLSVYLQNKGRMISMFRIPIGSQKVLKSFKAYFIMKNRTPPFGLTIGFLTKNGTEVEWVFFSSYNRFSFFTTENTASVTYERGDIDNNGVMDFIEWKHGLEEGTGYETYLTWYKWNGREFREKATTNVVRNLNTFFGTAAREILHKQWAAFFSTAETKNRTPIVSHGKDVSALFTRIFTPPSDTENKEQLRGCTDFRSVIFPKIFENPFTIGNSSLREVTVLVRFECYDGNEFIRSVRVAMNRNPFGKSEYFFILN